MRKDWRDMLESIGKEGFIGKSIGGESRRVEKLEI